MTYQVLHGANEWVEDAGVEELFGIAQVYDLVHHLVKYTVT